MTLFYTILLDTMHRTCNHTAMKLKEYRTLKGWTLADVKERLGLKSLSTISMIENGKRKPSPELAEKIEILTDGAVPFKSQLLGNQ